jgi:uncharacterized membrane protein YdjX (TVP38/TMEM64 family)
LPVFAGAIASLMLLAYLFVEAAAPDLPTALVSSVERRTLASFGGVVILAADCLLPVPASAVMILHGAIFGVAAGTMYSFVGAMIAAIFAFALGRLARNPAHRVPTTESMRYAERIYRRWGLPVVIVSRPIPILAETIAIIAGTSSMGFTRFTLGTTVGLLPTCVAYALIGAGSAQLANGIVLAGIACGTSALVWHAGPRISKLGSRPSSIVAWRAALRQTGVQEAKDQHNPRDHRNFAA